MSKNPGLRIGLTMRVVDGPKYYEPRDALAQDWPVFMKRVLSHARWLPIPNIGNDVSRYIENWDLNGFILTGGDDIGEAPLRDTTELSILQYAGEKGFPVLGICRGMQMICHYSDQKILPCPKPKKHITTTHKVRILEKSLRWHETDITVNSYHGKCVGTPESFRKGLSPFAVSEDGLVEGVLNAERTLLGIMWHPERTDPAAAFDEFLINEFFKR